MARVRWRIRGSGFKGAIDALDPSKLEAKIEGALRVGVQKMSIQAYKNAPVDTGALRASILHSVQQEGDLNYIFGSGLPYAQRQEYEHKNPNHNMYLHRAVWAGTVPLRKDLKQTIKRHFS